MSICIISEANARNEQKCADSCHENTLCKDKE